jgi:putative ATP-dependent endonuclease of the OLD family
MIIDEIRVERFRSIASGSIRCERLTALVGANGAGKSAFLRALELFYSNSPKIDYDDFYNRDISCPIVVSVKFTQLSTEAIERFLPYLQEECLTIDRVIAWNDGKINAKYHGSRLGSPDFTPIRELTRAVDKKAAYDGLQQRPEYGELPKWTNMASAPQALALWEEKHPDKCVRQRDDGQFFGFSEVAQGFLGHFTRLLFVPAVRDASGDAQEGRGSVFSELMDMVVRSTFANKEEILALKKEMQEKYQAAWAPAGETELSSLATTLTATLQSFAPGTSIDLKWQPIDEIDIPLPKAKIKLVEDDFESSVERTGHGLQRAYIMTMLQHLTMARTQTQADPQVADKNTNTALPDLVLVIEEPELYQHPNRQRHMAKILADLAQKSTPGVANVTQVIYATHSPLFVGIDRIEQLRLLRKKQVDPKSPKATHVVSTSLNAVAEVVWRADGAIGDKFTGATLLPRLQTIMTPWMNEGFFAHLVVLVEGEDDRSAILGTATSMGIDCEGIGISIIPCFGKQNMDRPCAIFKQLGIAVFLIWDGDKDGKDAKLENNHRLLRHVAQPVQDWPSGVHDAYACFEDNLEKTIQTELGKELFEKHLDEVQRENRMRKSDAIKSPMVMAAVLKRARDDGRSCATLEAIVKRIVELCPKVI